MKRGGPLKRKTRLSGTSRKRLAERGAWEVVKEVVTRRDGGACRLAGPECWGPRDHHHVRPVGRGGARLDPENVIILCRGHHRWAHSHPRLAEEMGVLR